MTDSSATSRRGFLLSAAALALTPQFVRQDPAAAAAELPGFPEGVELYRSAYRNWAGRSPRPPCGRARPSTRTRW